MCSYKVRFIEYHSAIYSFFVFSASLLRRKEEAQQSIEHLTLLHHLSTSAIAIILIL